MFVLVVAIVAIRKCSTNHIYTLSTLDHTFYNDIDITEDWRVVVAKGDTEYINDRMHSIGDTIEIVHTDYTTSKYILTAIK